MQRYLGLDVHATSCTLAVVDPTGKKLRSLVVETTGEALIEVVKTFPRPRSLCLEEGTQSVWLHELLSPHVDELVVTRVEQSRGPKDDCRDAFGLAEAMRLGNVRSVFKGTGDFARLRSLARSYDKITTDVTRTQSRLKALYRSRGVSTPGTKVYSASGREGYLAELPPSCRDAAELLYAELDALRELKTEAHKLLVGESHNHSISRLLESAPGMGPVRVAQLLPIVVTPHRFRTARQFWSYCGLGIVMRSTSDWKRTPHGGWEPTAVNKTRGLSTSFNRPLKDIFKGAATTVLTQRLEPMYGCYVRLTEAGTKPPLAKLTVARKIAAAVLAMWKNEEAYDPERTLPKH